MVVDVVPPTGLLIADLVNVVVNITVAAPLKVTAVEVECPITLNVLEVSNVVAVVTLPKILT